MVPRWDLSLPELRHSLCCPNLCWASSEIPVCGGEGGDVSDGDTGEGPQDAATPWTDSAAPAWLPSCCYCCCWTASDTLSELSQAWIIGNWNQLKHEPAEGSCCSLNCPLTLKKRIEAECCCHPDRSLGQWSHSQFWESTSFCLKLVLWGSSCPRLPLRQHKGRQTWGEDVSSAAS